MKIHFTCLIIILILLPLSSCKDKTTSTESIKIELYHSKSASFIHFLRSGFEEPHASKSIKEILDLNNINQFNDKKNISDFKKFWGYLLNGYNFKDTNAHNSGFYGEDALIGLSVIHPNLTDFEKNLPLLMPFEGVLAYTSLKEVFFPIFEEIMWKPAANNFKTNLSKLKRTMLKSDFNGLLKKAKVFYDSEYPKSIPMQLALVPIPDPKNLKKRHTSAQIIKNIQVVPYLTSAGANGSLDVIFHEFSHALYSTQTKKTRNLIQDFYLNSNDSHALFVYRYLNESLATALGNGIYKERLEKKYPTNMWYDNLYINGLAKTYFPTIKKYLSNNKKIDIDFLKTTLELAKNKFPNAPYEAQSNLVDFNLVNMNPNIDANFFINSVRKNFRVHSYGEFDNFKPDTVKQLLTKRQSLVIISNKTKAPEAIITSFNINTNLLKESTLNIFPNKGTYLFWIESTTQDDVAKAIEILKSIQTLPQEHKEYKL